MRAAVKATIRSMVSEVSRSRPMRGGRWPPLRSRSVFWKQYPQPRLQAVLVSTVREYEVATRGRYAPLVRRNASMSARTVPSGATCPGRSSVQVRLPMNHHPWALLISRGASTSSRRVPIMSLQTAEGREGTWRARTSRRTAGSLLRKSGRVGLGNGRSGRVVAQVLPSWTPQGSKPSSSWSRWATTSSSSPVTPSWTPQGW